jgi:hypothetical protein
MALELETIDQMHDPGGNRIEIAERVVPARERATSGEGRGSAEGA